MDEALEEAGLFPLRVYLARRREYLNAFIQDRPLHNICINRDRLPGTPTGTKFWWETTLNAPDSDVE